jgi:hypothetical protein
VWRPTEVAHSGSWRARSWTCCSTSVSKRRIAVESIRGVEMTVLVMRVTTMSKTPIGGLQK